MREIRLICKKELSRVLTDRKMLFSIFLLPAIIVLGQGGAYGMDASHTMEMYVVMGLLTALAFFRHRANIMRLAKGTENRVYLGKKDKK